MTEGERERTRELEREKEREKVAKRSGCLAHYTRRWKKKRKGKGQKRENFLIVWHVGSLGTLSISRL